MHLHFVKTKNWLKVLALILFLLANLMLITGCANNTPVTSSEDTSKDFQLRYDILFTDSKETVKKKLITSVGEDGFSESSSGDRVSVYGLTMSGIPGCFVSFDFSSNDELNDYSITYKLSEWVSKSSVTAEYDTINEGLIRKYGNPLDEYSDSYPIEGSAVYYARTAEKVYGHNKWVINCGKYFVKIDHVLCSSMIGQEGFDHVLSYHYFTQNEVDAKKQITQYLIDYKNDSVDNDL